MNDAERIRTCVGRVLRAYREAEGWSQERMSDQAGLHRNYIAGTERGERNISIVALSRWLPALRVSWEDFGRNVDQMLGE